MTGLRPPGEGLPSSLRKPLESFHRQDFSAVRVHADHHSTASARALGANAFTYGEHIAFDTTLFAPNSHRGRELLSHELDHVAHQRATQRTEVQCDLKALNRERSSALPNFGEAAATTFSNESAEAAPVRSALAALIKRGDVTEVRSKDGDVSWFAAQHHKGADLEPIRQAFTDAGFPLADRMARALYDIHGEYLFSGDELHTVTVLGDLKTDLGKKVRAQSTRSMTEWEIRQARRVFNDAIDYSAVTIEERSKFGGAFGYARTVGNTIYFPGTSYRRMSLLIHELTHVWQYQTTGWTYAPKAIWAQMTEGYGYVGKGQTADQALADARKQGKSLGSFNKEQQGDILRDYFKRLQSGADVTAFQPFVDDI